MSSSVNLIDVTSNILSRNVFCFENKMIDKELISCPIDNPTFGILNFVAVTSEETNEEHDFLFLIDCSSSMYEGCSDEKSKIQHIIHTLKNMVLFFNEHPEINVNITINAFDTQIYEIVTRTKVNNDNINSIISKIEEITPQGSTNIEFALQQSKECLTKLKEMYPTNVVSHIFMTDGEATEGSNEISVLQNLVDSSVINAFIGFGIEHDSSLLNGIGAVGKSVYYFIDKLESSGLVYGEILHSIIYKLVKDAEILIENGFIYNFKTNQWTNSLSIGDIVSEANKIYNILSDNPAECKINIKGNTANLCVLFPSRSSYSRDLTTHIYRQRTLQLLYEVNEFSNNHEHYDKCYQPVKTPYQPVKTPYQHLKSPNRNDDFNENKLLKSKLVKLLEEIKMYMNENNLMEDAILKNLCDDIYICFRTFGTRYGHMYCTARQYSQGSQRQYTASSVVTTNLYSRQRNDDLFNQPVVNHIVSDFNGTPYATPQATQIMREICGDYDDDHSNSLTIQIN